MAKNVRYVMNRKAFQAQVLYNPKLGTILASHLGKDAEISKSNDARGGGRIRARIYGSMSQEAINGNLSKRLGGGG